jgi:hypothetical protein
MDEPETQWPHWTTAWKERLLGYRVGQELAVSQEAKATASDHLGAITPLDGCGRQSLEGLSPPRYVDGV